jgi:PPE-repeat protein
MTAPLWMASPPELHSALLSSGPGPASLLAAAGAWSELSTEYASTAEQLSTVLAGVQAGAWEGPSSEAYVAAHVRYLMWLMRASADSATTAAQHETAATAYTAALAAMPTLPELAANHAIHGTLMATNFFGVNTIPIAVNEADYARMWTQAATTMTTYQAVSTAAVAATPQTDPAPPIMTADDEASPPNQPPDGLNGDNPLGLPQWLQNILKEFGIGNETVAHDPTIDNWFDNIIANLLHNFGFNWNPAVGTLNGFDYDSYTNPFTLIFWVARALELLEDFQQFGYYLVHNPVLAIQYLISLELFDWPLHIEEILPFIATQPELFVPVFIVVAAPVAALGAFAGLAALPGLHPAVLAPALVAPPAVPPVLGSTPLAAPAAAPTSAPAPAATPATSTVASPAPPSPPAAAPGPEFFPPYVIGPPGVGLGSGMNARASSGEKKKAPQPDAAAAAAAAARDGARGRRRRQRQRQRGHADEYMDMNVEVDPDWGPPPSSATMASDRGAGNLGFAGTARSEAGAAAAGLATLAGDEFGRGPAMPMMPGTWHPDGEENERARDGEGRDS